MNLLRAVQRTLLLLTTVAIVVSGDVARAEDGPPNGLAGTFGESPGSPMVIPASGAFTYSVSFELPANRGAAQPSLGLVYASGARTGEAGVGWSLSLPSIERAPLSGWPKYLDTGALDAEDRFVYDGAPLTFICTVGSSCPANDPAVGPMPSWANGYRHYRRQVEKGFERFFWSPGNSRWIVQERGGNLLEFGRPLTRLDLQDSIAVDIDQASLKVFRWNLAVQRDLHGDRNVVIYRWRSDSPQERTYLKDIYFTPPASGASGASLSEFAYHAELIWEALPFRSETFTFAEKRPWRQHLKRVAVAAKTWANAAERELVRAYDLTYYPERALTAAAGEAPLWGRSSLKSVTQEGRCGEPPIRETDGHLPLITGCPTIPTSAPALTFEYENAVLSSGTATFVPLDGPGTRDGLRYVTGAALMDVDRNGLPDIVEAWPQNLYSGPDPENPTYMVQYPECDNGHFVINAEHVTGEPPNQYAVPLLMCPNHHDGDKRAVRPARQQTAWVNRGHTAGGVQMQHHCLDAGGLEPGTLMHALLEGHTLSAPAPFTRGSAEAMGMWGSASMLWSVARYSGFGIEPLPPNGDPFELVVQYCPERYDVSQDHPALRWAKLTDSTGWARDPMGFEGDVTAHLSVVDLDGDGYGDLLTAIGGAQESNGFRRSAVRFTRKYARTDHVDHVVGTGPALYPFVVGAAPTVIPITATFKTWADVNGDGVNDLITAQPDIDGGAPHVRLGDGRGGFGCQSGADPYCTVAGNGTWLGDAYAISVPDAEKPWPLVSDHPYMFADPATGSRVAFVHDVTGDGLADIVTYEPKNAERPNGLIRLWVNVDGRTFRCANETDCVVGTVTGAQQPSVGVIAAPPGSNALHRISFADVDGNGSEDLVLLGINGMWSFSFLQVAPVPTQGFGGRAPKPGLLTRVWSGTGAVTEVVYQTLQHLDVAAANGDPAAFDAPWSAHVPDVLPIVTSIRTRDVASVAGTPLPAPFTFNRTRRFEYRDPAYDPWERSFKGFRRVREILPTGEVQQSWFYFGACEAGPFAAGGCTAGSDGGVGASLSSYPDKALVGALVRVDRFVPEHQETPLKWLSTTTTTYEVSPEFATTASGGGIPDRPVAWARPVRSDSFIYDTASAVSLVNITFEHPTEPQPAPGQSGRAHLRTDFAYDSSGNLIMVTAHGRVGETAIPIDDIIVTRLAPWSNRCSENWACSVNETVVAHTPVSTGIESELRRGHVDRNASEDVIAVWGTLFSANGDTARLERNLTYGVGAPSTALTNPGTYKLRTITVDDFGNATEVKGRSGPDQSCTQITYDAEFKQFPGSVTSFTGGGCGGTAIVASSIFDRGFGVATATLHPGELMEMVELDGFGRVKKVFAPDASGAPGVPEPEPSLEIVHHTQLPMPWTKVRRKVDTDAYIESIAISNSLGEPVLGFDQADTVVDGHPWILRGWTERDGAGRVVKGYRPWFFDGAPDQVADYAMPLSTVGGALVATRDAFGRVVARADGATATAEIAYLPLHVRMKDAEQLRTSGPYFGWESTAIFDGHGRVRDTISPGADDDWLSTHVDYLGTGEPALIRRSGLYTLREHVRTIEWDSFGRMTANDEPNTSGERDGAHRVWRYVYDSEGRLVGTSDARGCGENLHYDALGRIVAEDFSPCLAPPEQPEYSAPDLLTGDGTEVFYKYDEYEAGQFELKFDPRESIAVGRLVSVQDRSAHTRFSHDGRGRTHRVARRIARPGETASVLTARYTTRWFRQDSTFDFGDRLRKRTTGLDEANLLVSGESFESMTYSARGALWSIGSSYGDIVSDLRYTASGKPTYAKYGDRASTEVGRGYGPRERLSWLRVERAIAPALWSAPSTPEYPAPNQDTTQLQLAWLDFTHDAVGNPLTITDSSSAYWRDGAKPVSRTFEYDSAYRVKQVSYAHALDPHISAYNAEAAAGDRRPVAERTGSSRMEQQQFWYDAHGNVSFGDDNEHIPFDRSFGIVWNGQTSSGAIAGGPNQQLMSAAGDTATVAAYDLAGNLTALTVNRGTCDAAMPECTHRFLYDWDEVGQLVRARRWDFVAGDAPAHDPEVTPAWDLHYAHGLGGRGLTTKTSALAETRHTLDVFDTMRVSSVAFSDVTGEYVIHDAEEVGFLGGGAGRVFYDREQVLPMGAEVPTPLHVYLNIGDHLGSTAFVIDKDSGEVVERTQHQAFGKVESDYRPTRWAANREDFKFTGKEEDIEVGATYFGARFYNAHMGRWMSPDPLTIHGLGADLNPYAYVSGRVSSFVDPFGLAMCAYGNNDATGGCNEPPTSKAQEIAEAKAMAQELGQQALVVGTKHAVENIPLVHNARYIKKAADTLKKPGAAKRVVQGTARHHLRKITSMVCAFCPLLFGDPGNMVAGDDKDPADALGADIDSATFDAAATAITLGAASAAEGAAAAAEAGGGGIGSTLGGGGGGGGGPAATFIAGPGGSVVQTGLTPAELLMPNGVRIGTAGGSNGVRVINGGVIEAEMMYEQLSANGTALAEGYAGGRAVTLPGGGFVGIRTYATSTIARGQPAATIDVNIPGISVIKLKFVP